MGERWDTGETSTLDITPSPRLLEVLGDIPYKPWQCIAELVDNAVDEFSSNPDRDPAEPSAIHVSVPKSTASSDDAQVSVSDNGRGMSNSVLRNALRAGFTGNARYGSLGLFGMGFNIATARLGNKTEVRTTQAGDATWLVTEIDFRTLQRRETFHVPLWHEAKDDPELHGTVVTIRDLRPGMLESLKRPSTVTAIKDRLGRVYSYLLRDHSPIPEVSDEALAGCGTSLYLNGKRVQPRIPCVWSSSRSVKRYGADISAVRVIDRKLLDAYACMDCGNWHRHYDVDICAECGSENLELRQRRIHGWLGVQRYLDDSDFGIDFIRNGRAILLADRSLFTWTDPDTGEAQQEYPIEFPATQGRLIGEIHIDHVPVTYQKIDFDRSTRDWIDTVRYLRGDGPMRPKKAKERGYPDNDSPLGTLFRGFQENDPGIRCLIPGDGNIAMHKMARQWGELFHKGIAEFQSDEKWYEAVLSHEEIKNGTATRDGGSERGEGDLGTRTGLSPVPPATPSAISSGAPTGSAPGLAKLAETEEERYARYRQYARRLHDLEGDVTALDLAKRHVTVFETTIPVTDASGVTVPVTSRATSGIDLEVYVNGNHEIFREFGRDPRDYAIMEISQVLRALARDLDSKITVIAAEVTGQFPDQRMTDSSLRERADAVLRRIRDLAALVIADHASEMWVLLPLDSKLRAEREATRMDPRLDWLAASANGQFGKYLSYEGFASLTRGAPQYFMGGAVFSLPWASWSDDEARNRLVAHVIRLMETLGEFLDDPSHKGRQELAMTRLAIDMIDDIVARPE